MPDINIDALAELYYAGRDPQYESDRCRCDGCGGYFEYDELFEVGDRRYCADCIEYEDIERDEEDETEH